MRKLVAGAVAGLAAGFLMNQFSRAISGITRGHEGAGAAPGRHRVGRGAQPPQSRTRAEGDATVRVGSLAFAAVTGRRPSERERLRSGMVAHYAFSATLGVTYAVLQERVPIVTAGRGAAFGAAAWIVADEGVIPALGLSRKPRELGAGVLLYALFAHLVFGVALDEGHRRLTRGR